MRKSFNYAVDTIKDQIELNMNMAESYAKTYKQRPSEYLESKISQYQERVSCLFDVFVKLGIYDDEDACNMYEEFIRRLDKE